MSSQNKSKSNHSENRGYKKSYYKHSSKLKNGSVSNSRFNTYTSIPLYLIAGLVPIIMYLKKVTLNDPGNLFWDGAPVHYDIFSYYKMVYLLVFSAIGLLLYLILRKDNPFVNKNKKYYIPLAVYSLFILLSALASEYRQVSFFGFLERYEGAFVLIAYSVICFLSMNILNEEKQIKLFLGCLLASAAVITLLGTLQYLGIDYFKAESFLKLITPLSLNAVEGSIQSKMPPKTVFSTLYNQNYVGSYMAMLIPVILILLVFSKKIVNKTILAVLSSLALVCWIGCDSRAGIVGGILSLLIVIIMLRKKIWCYKKIAISALLLLCTGLTVFNFATDGSVVKRLKRMATLEGKGDNAAAESADVLEKTLEGLIDVQMDGDSVTFITENGTMRALTNDRVIKFFDDDKKELEYTFIDNIVNFKDNRFESVKMNVQADKGLIEFYYNDYHLIDALLTKEGFKSTTNRWMTYRKGRDIEAFGFKGMETFGSNRGYIWYRTIPLLKNTILTGNGPDTFAIYFPQYDFLSKLKYYGTAGIFVDKAHNMYLQTALNTGVVSLIALLALFGIYFVSSFRIYIKEEFRSFLPVAGLACFAAFCGYAVAGFFNDSVVSVAPVFWILLGMGIGINMKLAGAS